MEENSDPEREAAIYNELTFFMKIEIILFYIVNKLYIVHRLILQ